MTKRAMTDLRTQSLENKCEWLEEQLAGLHTKLAMAEARAGFFDAAAECAVQNGKLKKEVERLTAEHAAVVAQCDALNEIRRKREEAMEAELKLLRDVAEAAAREMGAYDYYNVGPGSQLMDTSYRLDIRQALSALHAFQAKRDEAGK